MKVGIIGTGYISTFHAAAYRDLGVEIAGVTDINKDSYLSKKDCYGAAVFFETADQLLGDKSIDAVSICTNTRGHFDAVIKAAQAGKHILCEKTLTDSGANSAKLVDALKDFDKNFQIGYMKRYFPATRKALELLPKIGAVISVHVRSYQGFEWQFDMYDMDGWKSEDGKESAIHRTACGGMLNMAGSHMLDLVNLLVGTPKRVYSVNWYPKDYDAETNSHSMFTLENGAVVHFEAALSPYARAGRWQDGWDERFEINGTKGRIELFYCIWDKPMTNAPVVQLYLEPDRTHTLFTFPKVDGFKAEVKAFVENCQTGVKSKPDLIDGYLVDKLISACYESSETGRVVEIQ